MLRTLLAVGVITVLGLMALKLVFGILGPLVSLVFWLLGATLRFLLIGAVVYAVIRVVSPGTARRIRGWLG